MAVIPPVDPNATVNPDFPIAPTSGIYGTLFQSFYGTLSDGVQQEIWVGFLNENGLSLAQPVPTDALTVNNFLGYAGVPTMPPNDGIYSLIFEGVFGHMSLDAQQQLWFTYLTGIGANYAKPPTDAASVNQFLTAIGAQTLPPISGDYARIMQAFFGNGAGGMSLEDQQVVFANYLIQNNLSFTTPPPTDSTSIENFMKYVGAVFKSQQFEIQSPEEVQKREIMSKTFDSVLNMLFNLQDTISVTGKTLIFYGNWQQEYTQAITRVPTYVGGSDNNVKVDTSDPTKFTFGYNNTSVDDIGQWFAQQYVSKVNNTFELAAPIDATVPAGSNLFGDIDLHIRYGIVATIQANGQTSGNLSQTAGTITLQAKIISIDGKAYDDPNAVTLFTAQVPIPSEVQTQAINSTNNNFSNIQTAFNNAFTTFYNDINQPNVIPSGPLYGFVNDDGDNKIFLPAVDFNDPNDPFNQPHHIDAGTYTVSELPTFNAQTLAASSNASTPPAASPMGLPWVHNTVAAPTANTTEGDGAIANADSKARAEMNSRNQQFIENLRGFRKSVQSKAQALQGSLDQARQAVTNQADLLNSILDSLKSIIASIFR